MDIDDDNLQLHFIKSYDVMVLGIVYLIFGLASSYLINRLSPSLSKGDSRIKISIEIMLEVAVTVLFSYIIHQVVERMPLPMAGSKELQYKIIREVRGGIVIAFAMFSLQIKLRNRIQYLFYHQIDNFQLVDLSG